MRNAAQFVSSILVLLVALAACALPSTNPASTTPNPKEIPLSLARKIVPQRTSAVEMKQLLGEPDAVQILEADPREIWVYLRSKEPATRRMYAFVNSDSRLVESVTWNVFEGDPESELKYVKKELGNPELTKSEPKWTKGDAAPDVVYFKSERQRLTIVLRKTLNQVDMIMWR